MVDLNKTYLYRITHIVNVPHILEYGVTHVLSAHVKTRLLFLTNYDTIH